MTYARRGAFAAVALTVIVASLVWFRDPAADPTAWLIWGRELVHGSLDTVGGPSWKPLPVLFTMVFAAAGAAAAPLLWLVVARAAGLAALVLAYRIGGALAVAGLAVSTDFLYNVARGDSEGLLVALALGAVLAQLRGRPRAAFALGTAAALVRPEVAPVLAAQGAWLVWTRRDVSTVALVAGAGIAVAAAWLVPDLVTTGNALRSAVRAERLVRGSPAESGFPFGAALLVAAQTAPWPVYAGAIYRVARRERTRADVLLAAATLTLIGVIAAMSQLGFSGGPRYFTLPTAGLCVLGGLGLPLLVAAIRPRVLLVPLAALAAAGVVPALTTGHEDWRVFVAHERVFGRELPLVIRRAGGAAALRACPPVATTPFARNAVAYRLRLPMRAVTLHPITHGTIVAHRGGLVAHSSLPRRAGTVHLAVRSSC